MAKIKSMKIGVKDDPSTFKDVKLDRWVESKGKVKFFQGKSNAAPIENNDPCLRPAKIVSRLKHNVTLSYMGQGMIISAHARRMINDYEKLGAIPSGITVIPVPNPIKKK